MDSGTAPETVKPTYPRSQNSFQCLRIIPHRGYIPTGWRLLSRVAFEISEITRARERVESTGSNTYARA